MLKIDNEKIKRFPDAFDELAKVFNFFILEWTKKFIICKQKYIYSKISTKNGEIREGNDDADEILKIAQKYNNKIEKLSGDRY